MKITTVALIALLSCARGLIGCGGGGGHGDGGTGGGGGDGGTGGTPWCYEDGYVFVCESVPATPPTLTDACTSPSLENSGACDVTGLTTVTHKLSMIMSARSPDIGFDLDGTDAAGCVNDSSFRPVDGANGVDNAVGSLGPFLESTGGSLDCLDLEIFASFCDRSLDIALEITANTEAGCAKVQVVVDGIPVGGPADLNFSGECLSGVIGDIPLAVGVSTVTLANSTIAVTVGAEGLANGVLGATVAGTEAVPLATALCGGACDVLSQVFDIRTDLDNSETMACDAVSLTLNVGGVVDAAAP